jgi:hypothetical protein
VFSFTTANFFEDISKDTRKTVSYLIDVKTEAYWVIENNVATQKEITYGKILQVLPFEAKSGSPITVSYTTVKGYAVDAIIFEPLPKEIEEKIEEISSKAKAKISSLKTQKLAEQIAKDYGIEYTSGGNYAF